jgi:WD40 repeat protein
MDLSYGAFAPDGRTLALARGDVVQLFDLATGKEVRRLEGQQVFGTVAFSPDGRTLLTANLLAVGTDHTVRLWDVTTGKEVWRVDTHPWGELRVAFAPDGRTVAAVGGRYDTQNKRSEGAVLLLDAATGKELHHLAGHRDQVQALAFAPDGRTLATGGWDRTVRFWEVATGRERRQPLTAPAGIRTLSCPPDGR